MLQILYESKYPNMIKKKFLVYMYMDIGLQMVELDLLKFGNLQCICTYISQLFAT